MGNIELKDLQLAVDSSVSNLRRAVRNLRKFAGSSGKLPPSLVDSPIVHLDQRHVEGCKVFCNRNVMLTEFGFPRGGIACEIGTSTGIFAKEILKHIAPEKMYIVDIDFSRFDKALYDHPAVSTFEMDSAKAIVQFDDQSIDYAYIDADHSYKFVKSEITKILPKMKPGGYLMFNDYTRFSVNQVLPYGVVAAVNELLVEKNWQMVGIALSGTTNYDVAVRVGR